MFADNPVSFEYSTHESGMGQQVLEMGERKEMSEWFLVDYLALIKLDPRIQKHTYLKFFDRSEILKDLDEISNLEENWDSRGGNSVSEQCIGNAWKLILGLNGHTDSPDIYPNPNGTITMDWETSEQLMSIEIGNTLFNSYWETSNETEYESGRFEEKMPSLLFRALENIYPNPAPDLENLAVSTY